jgi:rod shape-determining protein MreD
MGELEHAPRGMGDDAMNWLHIGFIMAAAYLAVFVESSWNFPRNVLGVQLDVLPALMVYTALTNNIFVTAGLALFGGLCFDSVSANPLGISVLPLLIIGFVIDRSREFLVRESVYMQAAMGASATAGHLLLTLFFLMNLRVAPPVGWGTLWQLIVLAAGGAVAAPCFFALFDRVYRAFDYQPAPESSFRTDREIKRGKG